MNNQQNSVPGHILLSMKVDSKIVSDHSFVGKPNILAALFLRILKIKPLRFINMRATL